jgi:hypothetical protein
MREPLLEHVQNFTESQRAHVSKGTMEVLYEKDSNRKRMEIMAEKESGVERRGDSSRKRFMPLDDEENMGPPGGE